MRKVLVFAVLVFFLAASAVSSTHATSRVYVSFDFTFTQRENAHVNLIVNGATFGFSYTYGQWTPHYGWSNPDYAVGLLRVVTNGNVDSVYGYIDCPEGYIVKVGNIQWTNELIVGPGFCGSFSNIQLSTSQSETMPESAMPLAVAMAVAIVCVLYVGAKKRG